MPILLLASFFIRIMVLPVLFAASFFVPVISLRRNFEKRNLEDPNCRSFNDDGLQADLLIHFSSEGEFEQVRPIIEECLRSNKKVELLFTSPSVEKKVQRLANNNDSSLLRYRRLPLLCFLSQNVNHWVSARQMIMVRYDFFPELLMLGRKMEQFILLLGSARSSNSSKIGSYIKALIYKQYHHIFPTTQQDLKYFENIQTKKLHGPMDLRPMQIFQRQKSYQKTHWDFLKQYNHSQKIILAQLWPGEVSIFDNPNLEALIKELKVIIVVAPHKFESDFVEQIKVGIKNSLHSLPIYHVKAPEDVKELDQFSTNPGVILTTIGGELCEIYQYFDGAFVGGGHGKGVHSLFEPFIAGAHLACGPNISRSTEYEQIISKGATVELVSDLKRCIDILADFGDNSLSSDEFVKNSENGLNTILTLLGIKNA